MTGSFFSRLKDSIFSYQTPKIVKIHDTRLALIHYAFMILIFAYVVGFQIVWEKNYLMKEPPTGTIRISTLKGNLTGTKVGDYPYCRSNVTTNIPSAMRYRCLFWDEGEAVFPVTEQSAVFLSSRVTTTNLTLACSMEDPACSFTAVSQDTIYVGGVENFTLMFDHAFYTATLNIQANAKDIAGRLLDTDNNQMNVPLVGQSGSSDILDVNTILRAANVKLDDMTSGNETFRYSGLLILCFIKYDNTHSYNTDNIRYTITFTALKSTEFKAVEQMYNSLNASEKTTRNRHGLRILFFQNGDIGKFEFQVLLLTLVSGLALTAIATLITDMIALMMLPDRKIYEKSKYKDVDTESLRRATMASGNPVTSPLVVDHYA
eukprot:TRINITY_DN9265_c0_g1_i1.p1 TRINITY_DN9265_c0_g1~~TRINITY_DN9265_c0_g1_i1.p1  ORF type:complete len:376 (-),score=56.37 TRINITY_DN9265_c0_g1_i1:108-1235(-)